MSDGQSTVGFPARPDGQPFPPTFLAFLLRERRGAMRRQGLNYEG